jgi:paraquat-inducible protein B
MNDAKPSVSAKKRVSPLWIIPIVAAFAGIWMIAHAMMTEGPTVAIEFATADGLEAGKTKVRVLNVEVGMVEAVELMEDMSGVLVMAKLEPNARGLLREDTRFWVVKARIGAGGVSGLGTLLSGAFIELAPGEGDAGRREFLGLERPPLTPIGAPGLHLTLFTDDAGSVSTGNPVYYRGLRAGRVESIDFDSRSGRVQHTVFIDQPFDELVTTSTRFWNNSGITFDASAEGVKLRIGALDSVISGGIAFESPPDLPPGAAVTDGNEFRLYSSYSDILSDPFEHGSYYVVQFDGDVAGLKPGAPVLFRGLKIGRVVRIQLKELMANIFREERLGVGKAARIPVLIYLEPARLEAPDTAEAAGILQAGLERSIHNGLRATLQTGSLLTGSKQIYLGFFPNAPAAEMGQFGSYRSIPTIDSGLGEIQHQFSDLLAKINSLPLEDTVVGANTAISRLDDTLESLETLLASESTQGLPDELAKTLAELRNVLDGLSQDSLFYQDLASGIDSLNKTLQNLDRLSRDLADRPNSLIFAPAAEDDPVPEARR